MSKENVLKECMLTTLDNPFDPFDDFNSWYLFDMDKKYYSCSRVADKVRTSNQFSEKENCLENEKAIDEIIKDDPENVFKKVSRFVTY